MRFQIPFVFLILAILLHTAEAWRRRRRRCRGCAWSNWGSYGTCSASCNWGKKYRSRYKTNNGGCGAVCYGSSTQSANCYLRCCPVNCAYSWSSWSRCARCGWSLSHRTPTITQRPACGGTACPTTQHKRCYGGCCPVNCVVNSWGSWGACNAACEQSGQQTRTRSIRTRPSCKGTACPTLIDTKPCKGGCCRRDCLVSSWSAWSKCNAPSGKCGPNAGTRSRSRQITRQPSCGGKACPSLGESGQCTPVPISCLVSSWSSFSKCTANNGNCGPGTQYRTRKITRNPYCSSSCPSLKDTRSCSAGCCPVNCAVSAWSSWSACTSTCGTGTKTRTRSITTNPSCNGQACPVLKSTVSCSQYNNKDCVMSAWSSWSQCSNGCGNGLITKTRRVTTQPVCQGKKCGPSSASKVCTSYRDNRDCKVGSWTSWGSCSTKCAVGTRQRTRSITIAKRCRGKPCPTLMETSQCGTANGGCKHICSNNVCSCRPGYNLGSDRKTCIAKNCGAAKPSFCAQGTKLGSTCKYAVVTCPGNKTTYPVTCSLGCPKYYSLKGVSTITCQTSGRWTSYSSTYCRRNNDPPTQILLSGSSSVAENQPLGTKVGTFSSIDSVNSKDTHTYTIVKGGNGLYELKGADLLTLKTFNYESSPNSFDITIRSTDNGVPAMYLDKTFTIKVTDVNESPTDIQLSSTSVDENSDMDTTVGMLSTADPDKSQSFTYLLLDNAGGRFKVVKNLIKVAQSNRLCLQSGGPKCILNYEQQNSHVIRVRSTDSGTPSKSIQRNFSITINDINDRPRDLKLSNKTIKENAPINTVIGQFTARDEDINQRLVYSLIDDDNGRFKTDRSGRLLKAKDTDYETNKVHSIVANVTDNGNPAMTMSRKFSIVVLNENDAPVSITLDKTAVKENSVLRTHVATVTANDADASQQLTFSLDDDAGGKFALGNQSSCQHRPDPQNDTLCTTTLMVSGNLDYEDAQWEMITIRVTDNQGKFISKNENITILDVNDKPTNITLEGGLTAEVFENSRNIEIGELQTEDQDHGQSYNYTLLTNGNGNFEIRGSKLYITRSATLDYEVKTSYRLNVRSTDSGKPQYSIENTLIISVKDQNEAPTDIILSNATVIENTPTGTLIGSLSITDPDNFGPQGSRQSHTCQLTDSANGMIGISMNNNVNQLTVGVAGVNFEAKSIVGVIVECTDPDGLHVEKAFNVTVLDVNEAPSKMVVSNLNVKENQKTPTIIGDVTVSDPDNLKTQRQTFTFYAYTPQSGPPGIPGLQVPFDVRNGTLVAMTTLDFESKPLWSFYLRATDNGVPPMFKSQQISVQVLDTNDRPTDIQISNAFLDENSPQDTVIGALRTTDEDTTQSHTYKCIDCANGRFKIYNNELRVAQSNQACLAQGGAQCTLNYEAVKKYPVKIQSTDDGIPPYDVNTTIYVILRDVNDQPRDLKLSNNKVLENATIDTLIGQFSARDEDVSQTLTFSLVDDDNGRFRVDSSGKLYKAKGTNYETQKTHSIRAVVTDNGSPAMKMEKTFIIEVLNVNEPPVSVEITSTNGQVTFPKNSPRIKENSPLSTSVGTLVALDADANQTITFKLDDDASGMFILFSKSSCSSVTNVPGYNTKCSTLLKLNGKLNYEKTKSYSITIRVTDNHGLFKVQQLTVNVIDLNEKPTNISLSALSVNENANGALVGVLSTTDEDLSQSYSYQLTNDASGRRFEIQGDKLYVSSNANLNYEAQTEHRISIQVQDSGSPPLSFSKGFSITVNDVNEAPSFFNISNYHVMENSIRGTLIGSFSVRDPDNFGPQGNVQTHICSVVGSQVGKFVVQKNVLKVGSALVNYEQASVVDVQVSCSDNGKPSLSLSKTVQVIVDDINESPKNISLSSNSIAENSPPSLVGTLSTDDPDNEFTTRQSFTYRMVGNANGLPFAINGSELKTTRSLDYEMQKSWKITIQSTDSGKPPKNVTNTFTISVVDVNEGPTLVSLSKSTIQENSDKDTLIGVLTSQDPDLNQKHSYTLLETASGRFKIEQNKLKVAISNVQCLKYGGSFCRLNYESQRQHTIRVRSTDNGVPPLYKEQTFTINVTDVNDCPRFARLSGYSVMENATTGTQVGLLSANDEDAGQVVSFSLLKDDNGRFKIDNHNYLVKAKSTDYETNKKHVVTVQLRDNGSPTLTLTRNITIFVLDINEAPINTTITSKDGQQAYPDNYPRVNENSPNGTVVGTIISLDRDEVQVLNFALIDDASGKFAVSHKNCQNLTNTPGVKSKCSAMLTVNKMLNYEQSSSEVITVKVTDPKGSSHSQTFTITVLDVNDRPSDVTLSGGYVGYVDENANNALVGNLAVTDEDAGQAHTYRLINNGGWKFVVKGDKVYTSMYANLNFEKRSTYTIKVRAIDNGRPKLFMDRIFTIKVNDVNEQPTDILLSNYSVPENSPIGVIVGKISVIDPDNLGPRGDWQAHACIIVNDVPFIVNQSTNDLIVAGSLNHEATPFIDVILRCHDNGSKPLYLDKKHTVHITDINEAPRSISLSESMVAENSGILSVGKFNTIDPDNLMSNVQTFTYSLIGGDNLPFVIDGDSLNTTRSLDYEAKSTWQITIKSTDNKGLSVQKNFSITVTDRNDVPSGLNATGPFTCNEHSPVGTYLGTVSTVDEDAGQTFTYTIESVLALGHLGHKRNDSSVMSTFSIDPTAGVLTLSSTLNFEQFTKYIVLVRSVDSGTPPLSVTGHLDVIIQDINEAPNNITLSSNTVNENSPVDTIVGNLSVHDPDNAVISWQRYSCQVNNPSLAPFKVVDHVVLEVAEDVLNYETSDTYIVGVTCIELKGGNYTISTTFSIYLIDVNESPYNLTLSNTSIPENVLPGGLVGTINVLDPDRPENAFGNVTVKIQTQTPSDAFRIDGWNLVTTRPLDFELVDAYQVTIIAQDSGIPPLKIVKTFNIDVLDMNDPPSKLILNTSGVYENATAGTVVGTLTAIDEDKPKQTFTFSVVSPRDLFNVRGNELLLKSAALNYESSTTINVSISVTDDGHPSKTSELQVIVQVLDSNDPPSDITVKSLLPVDKLKRIMVKENSPGEMLVANLTVVDQDISQKHTCFLQDGQNWFETKMVSRSTAQVFVKKTADLDYETMNDTTIALTVLCTDSGSPPYSTNKSFSVIITDVNERPYNITLSGNHMVEEHSASGTAIGSLSCSDPDFDQTHVFKVTGTSSNIFGVDANTSVLYVKDPSGLDYESSMHKGTITVSIIATDSATKPLNVSRDFILRIIDVNEAPNFVGVANTSVREDVPIGSCIAKISTTDPDPGQNVTLTLLSHRDTFTFSNTCVNKSTGESEVRFLTNIADLSYDGTYPTHLYAVLIEAKDDGTPPKSFNKTIFVPINRVNPCDTKDDCNGNATCVRVNGTAHTCRCNPGFTGNGWNCSEIDECSSNPCLYSSSICSNRIGDPCQGNCTDSINNYTCSCPKGFTGNYGCLPIDYCASNPCQNNATCEIAVFNATFKCYCMLGFKGVNCSINIDDCQPHNCYNHGDCTDGINRFDCSCYEGYSGPKCQRNIHDCDNVECKPNEICVLPDISKKNENEQKLCYDRDLVLPIYFKPNVFALEEVKTPHWQYLFQTFVTEKIFFKIGDVTGDEANNTRGTATDLYVMETTTLSLYPLSDKRVRKSTDGKIHFTAVFFVVKYNTYGVKQSIFYWSLKDACKLSNIPGVLSDFEIKICNSGLDMITRLHIKRFKPSTGASEQDNRSLFGLHPYMYYVFAGIGGMLLLLLIIGVALFRRNKKQKRQNRAFRTNRELLDNSNLPTDVMQRHQLSNEGQGEGTFNPMYDVDGLYAQPSFSVSDNPIYSKPDDEEEQIRRESAGFTNPMYETFKPEETDRDNINSDQPLKSEENAESLYQVPTKSTVEKKKKKKKGKKKKGKSNDDEIPDVASVNPMFENREIYNDPDDEDDRFYGSSEKKHEDDITDPQREPGDDAMDNLYAVPKGKQDGDVTTPTGGSGEQSSLMNIYDSPRNSSRGATPNLDEPEPVPSDVVSAFGFSAAKTIGGTSGQTDC